MGDTEIYKAAIITGKRGKSRDVIIIPAPITGDGCIGLSENRCHSQTTHPQRSMSSIRFLSTPSGHEPEGLVSGCERTSGLVDDPAQAAGNRGTREALASQLMDFKTKT